MAKKSERAVAAPLETPEREVPNHGPIHDSHALDEILASLQRIEKLLKKP